MQNKTSQPDARLTQAPWPEPVTVDKMAYGGKGVARVEGKVWFIADAVPGDVLLARPTSDNGRYGEAEIATLVTPSPLRHEPRCTHARSCGGCQWMGIAYEEQLAWKESFVRSSLSRIGKLDPGLPITMHGSPEIYNYRNRILVRAHFPGDGPTKLGYFKKGTRELVPIKNCDIAAAPLNAVLAGISGLDVLTLGPLKIRLELQEVPAVDGSPGVLVTVYPAEGSRSATEELTAKIRALPGVAWAGLVFDLADAPVQPFDQDGGLSYLTYPGQFQQINMALNRTMRRFVREVVDERQPSRILDVCCGSGNLSLGLADGSRYVEGVESSRAAINCARKNVEANLVTNARYLAGDAEKHLWKCSRSGERFDLVLLDPPRTGLYKGMVPLKNLAPATIIYVSCDPSTLARDLGYLCRNDEYSIKSLAAFDLFPNTYHVETMVVLHRQ